MQAELWYGQRSVPVDSLRQAAVLITDELRRRGFETRPEIVAHITRAIEAELERLQAADKVVEMATIRLHDPIEGLGRRVERIHQSFNFDEDLSPDA